MTIKASTGLRNHVLATNSFKNAMDGGKMYWYSGTEPADADAAIDGAQVLLVTISLDGDATGLTFASSAASGILGKSISETWEGTIASSGLASFFRFCESGDTPAAASTTAKRFQGSIGAVSSGADIELTDPNLTATENQPVDTFNVTLPVSGP
jgi:hypothetical protein